MYSEVILTLLKESLGKLPVFLKLDPQFQARCFKHLKSIHFTRGESIFLKGARPFSLCFLVRGEVHVLSQDSTYAQFRLTSTYESVHARASSLQLGEELLRWPSEGCFGQSMLRGLRRPATHRAGAKVDIMTISDDSMDELLAEDRSRTFKLCTLALTSYARTDWIRSWTTLLSIAREKDERERCAKKVQVRQSCSQTCVLVDVLAEPWMDTHMICPIPIPSSLWPVPCSSPGAAMGPPRRVAFS